MRLNATYLISFCISSLEVNQELIFIFNDGDLRDFVDSIQFLWNKHLIFVSIPILLCVWRCAILRSETMSSTLYSLWWCFGLCSKFRT
jgi:hypothetical protein